MRLRIPTEHVASETVDGEVVILDQANGSYYSLRGAGADIWALLERLPSIEQVYAAAQARFDADGDVIRAEVERLLAELEREALLVRVDREAGGDGGSGSNGNGSHAEAPLVQGPRVPWRAPTLEKYTDLQQLLLLDPIHEVDESGWPRPAKDHG